MQQYSDTFMTDLGRPVRPESNAKIAVYTYPGNVLAVLYSDNGVTPKGNPVTTDANGLFEFYAADGRYSLVFTSDVTTDVTLTDAVLLEDPVDNNAVVKLTDYASLQAALNTGKLVDVTGVTYAITSQVTIPAGGGIIGKGTLTVSSLNFTNTTPSTINAQSIPIYALSVNDITLRDFKIVGTCGQNSHLYPIALRGVNKAKVQNLDISGMNGGSLLKLDSCTDIDISFNNLHDCTIDRTSTGQLTGIEVDDNRLSGVGSKRIDITFNRITNLTWTPAFLASYGPQTDGINFQVGTVDSIVACNIMDGVGEGVDCFGDDNTISANTIKNALGFGLKLIHGASRNLLVSNRIIDSGLGGIVVAGSDTAAKDTDENRIFNNFISGAGTNPGGYWVQPMYGIGFNNDGTFKPTNTLARGNTVVNSPGATSAFQGATAGTGNVYEDNNWDGTAAAEFSGSGFTAYRQGYEGDSTGLTRISGASPRVLIDETDAGANERLWDTVFTAGDMERRTRTDADGAGATFELIQRTGATVDLIRWNASAMKFGGVTAANRYSQFSDQGVLTQRFSDNGANNVRIIENHSITGAGQGYADTATFGAGGVSGGTAIQIQVLSTDTWAAAGNRSAKFVMRLPQANVLTDTVEFDPSKGLLVTAAGNGLRVKEGSNAKQGTATLVAGTVTVANTSVTANSRILLTSQVDGGTPGFLRVSARVAATSFTITSSSGTDTSTVAYQIFEPA